MQPPHEAGEQHHVHVALVQCREPRAFVVEPGAKARAREHDRLDAEPAGAVQNGRARLVAEESHDAAAEQVPLGGKAERLEVRARAGGEHGESYGATGGHAAM